MAKPKYKKGQKVYVWGNREMHEFEVRADFNPKDMRVHLEDGHGGTALIEPYRCGATPQEAAKNVLPVLLEQIAETTTALSDAWADKMALERLVADGE